jgi:hypothetical protein
MSIETDSKDMSKVRIYNISLAVCGAILGLMGLFSVMSGSIALVPVLLSIGGIGMVAGVAYDVFISPNPNDTVPDDSVVWFTVAMAIVGVLAGFWSVIG